jgi:hypothetical protein
LLLVVLLDTTLTKLRVPVGYTLLEVVEQLAKTYASVMESLEEVTEISKGFFDTSLPFWVFWVFLGIVNGLFKFEGQSVQCNLTGCH